MLSTATPPANLDALLRAACRRALGLGLSFIDQIRAYRSILAMAREARLRCGGSLFETRNQSLSALLAEVCERACGLGLDPEIPFPDAILVERLAVRLSRAARLAGEPNAAGRMIRTQDPVHREEPVRHDAAEPAEQPILAQDPLQRETEEPDYSLSAWRNDHTTERDRRAYEKLRTVIDDRLISKVKAMNRRDREEREAAERAAAA